MAALKPQDVVVVLKLCALAQRSRISEAPDPTLAALALQLGMSASEVHAAIGRGRTSGLLRAPIAADSRNPQPRRGLRGRPVEKDGSVPRQRRLALGPPNVTAVAEFLVHGLKYVFPPQRGEVTRGLPTAYAAPPLRDLVVHGTDLVPVWPWPEGSVRGVAFEPLYPSVPFAAIQDELLYEYLAIADALREGRVRERKMAERELRARLEQVNAG
jgi:hypothetical protein